MEWDGRARRIRAVISRAMISREMISHSIADAWIGLTKICDIVFISIDRVG